MTEQPLDFPLVRRIIGGAPDAPARQFRIMTLFPQDFVVLGRYPHKQIVIQFCKLAKSHKKGFLQIYVCVT